MKNIELPLNKKRSKFYRALEMLPGLLSYGALILLVFLSIINPLLASIYLLLIIITMLVRVVVIAAHTILGHRRYKHAMQIDWRDRLDQLEYPGQSYEAAKVAEVNHSDHRVHLENLQKITEAPANYPKPSQLYNAVIVAAYNEPIDVIKPTIEALVNSTHDTSRMIVIFAYEERGGDTIRHTAEQLKLTFQSHFKDFMLVMHPADIPGEIIGKGPNITFAAKYFETWCKKEKIDKQDVIITTIDCDNKPSKGYFDYVTYEYIVHEDRQKLSYQPLALYFSNIWDVPAPMRIIATGNSFWTFIVSMRPHMMRNFAAHSQPMQALSDMNYWSRRTIVEDGHQYWRSYFHFDGDYQVIPIHVPIYQDAVLADSLGATLKAQFKQLRRWAYGASDVPYVGVRVFSKQRTVPFWGGVSRFFLLVDSHVTLAVISILVGFGAWIPLVVNPEASSQIVVHNLPEVVSILQRVAMVGLFVTILISTRLLPKRPERYKRRKSVFMVLQWVLMPLTAILYNSMSAFNAQTHLLLGKYLDKFDVTEKATFETAEKAKQTRKSSNAK